MADDLYQKSILLEIINKADSTEAVVAFTLTIPPEGLEITQSQRINRTPTFGGFFEDDYGLGTAKISISGTTGNQELRSTWIPGKGSSQQFSGKDAIFFLRDTIIRYKTKIDVQKLQNYEMRFYDLSSMETFMPVGIRPGQVDGWIVSLDDFKISRNKDKPLWYSYSIELVGISPIGFARQAQTAATGQILTKDGIQDAIDQIRSLISQINAAYAWANNILNQIDNVNELLNQLEAQVVEYIQAAGNLISKSLGIYTRMFSVAKFPAAIAKAAMQVAVDVVHAVKDAANATLALANLGDDYLVVAQLANQVCVTASQIGKFGKSQQAMTDTQVTVGGNPITVQAIKTKTLSAGTTLAKIAVQEYGDPALYELIALFNNITDSDIVAGTVIQVPILVRSTQNLDNKIYETNLTTLLGIDVQLGNAGQIVVSESGDFAMVSDQTNMVQAINLRLNENMGRRLRLTTYGLRNAVGFAASGSAPVSYVIANLVDTLKQDPRIVSVSNIKLRGQADQLFISFNAETVDEAVSYQGVL